MLTALIVVCSIIAYAAIGATVARFNSRRLFAKADERYAQRGRNYPYLDGRKTLEQFRRDAGWELARIMMLWPFATAFYGIARFVAQPDVRHRQAIAEVEKDIATWTARAQTAATDEESSMATELRRISQARLKELQHR